MYAGFKEDSSPEFECKEQDWTPPLQVKGQAFSLIVLHQGEIRALV